MTKGLKLEEIVLIGRTFEEYFRMFGFDLSDLKRKKILDVASGVSSFCAEANSAGYNVTASDRIYCYDANEIEEKCVKDLDQVMGQMPEIMDLYKLIMSSISKQSWS
ncbi:MAG: hypothetical protein ACYCX4_09685 [Bacillota bacterium]